MSDGGGAYGQAKRCLLIVDVQNDFCPGGALPCEGGDVIARDISAYAQTPHVRRQYDVIVGTKDWHIDPGSHFAPDGVNPDFLDTWPVHCQAGSVGAQAHPSLDPAVVDHWFLKGEYEAAYSGFEGHYERTGPSGSGRSERLGPWLRQRGIEFLDVCGIATDFCVKATVLDGIMEGFSVSVFPDLCAGVARESSVQAIDDMRRAGAVVKSRTAMARESC
ncbi:isochorismatase family protein [Corynebacterium kroppenstedtii]